MQHRQKARLQHSSKPTLSGARGRSNTRAPQSRNPQQVVPVAFAALSTVIAKHLKPALAALCLILCALPAKAAPWPSYERWQAYQDLNAQERHVLAAARQWARAHNLTLAYDARLGRAAKRLLPWTADHAGEPLPLERLRHAAWRQGWTDGSLAAVALQATTPRNIPGTVYGALESQLGQADLTHIGVAIQGDNVVLALSHRLVRMAPIQARLNPGDTVLLTGHKLDPDIARLTFIVGMPDGTVKRLGAVSREDGSFEQRLQAGEAKGLIELQVLVERGQGPEVAVQCPIGVGVAPWKPEDPNLAPGNATEPDETTDPRAALTALIWGVRDAHGLDLPPVMPVLQTVAQAHADDMQSNHFFAHASPVHGDPTDRLRAVGQGYEHVVENLADASTVDAAFWQWMHSPSHRANVLDARVEALGVGMARDAQSGNVLAVLMMADLR